MIASRRRRRTLVVVAGVGAGLALAAYGARRAYLAGIDAGAAAASAAAAAASNETRDDDDDDEYGDAPDAPDASSSRRPVADADAAVPSHSPARDTPPADPPPTTSPPTTSPPTALPRDLASPSATPPPASSPPPFGAAYATTPPASTGPTSRPARRDLDRDIIPSSRATPSRVSTSATAAATTTTTTTSASSALDAVAAFDLDAVARSERWFHFEAPPGIGVWPVPYTSRGCPKDAARAIVVTLDDAPAVAAAGAACAGEVTRALGEADVSCFAVSRGSYHVPVFHLSLPSNPVSDPTAIPSGDGEHSRARSANPAVSLATAPLKAIGERLVTDHAREEALAATALRARNGVGDRSRDGDGGGDKFPVSTSSTLSLEIDRVAMSSDGALEMFFRDPEGSLAAARASLRDVFPGAPSASSSSSSHATPSIARCVLLRAFPRTSTALAEGRNGRSLADAKAACARWTARVAGTRVAARRAWLVREERFESLDGPKRSLEL